MGRRPFFPMFLLFCNIRRNELMCSHVRRPPYAHMGAHQLFLTIRAELRNLNENRIPIRRCPSLPCATLPESLSERPPHNDRSPRIRRSAADTA